MSGDYQTCGCGRPVSVFVTFHAPGRAVRYACLDCLSTAPTDASGQPEVDDSGLVEVKCEECGNLFATHPEHSAFFCSLACQDQWRAVRTFERLPY